MAISAITVMELTCGVEQRGSATLTAARHAGVVRAAWERIGVALSLADSQIAGHALALDVTLVSTDAAFKRVRGLTVKNWAKP